MNYRILSKKYPYRILNLHLIMKGDGKVDVLKSDLYFDVQFCHQEHSNIIFDSLYELVISVIGEENKYKSRILDKYGLSRDLMKTLGDESIKVRHNMGLSHYLNTFNSVVDELNGFLVSHIRMDPLEKYKPEKFVFDIHNSPLKDRFREISIMNLYDHFLFFESIHNERKTLRLQMFFENAIKEIVGIDDLDIFEIINNDDIMRIFVNFIFDYEIADNQLQLIKTRLIALNRKRNIMKKHIDAEVDVDYKYLKVLARMVNSKFSKIIDEIAYEIFKGTHGMVSYKFTYLELNNGTKWKVLLQLKENGYSANKLYNHNSLKYLKKDRVFQWFYINEIIGGIKLDKYNVDKMVRNLDQFNEITSKLQILVDSFEDKKDELDNLVENLSSLKKINNALNNIDKIDFKKLERLLAFQEEFPDNTKLEKLLVNLSERITDLNNIEREVRQLGKSLSKIERQQLVKDINSTNNSNQ